MEGCVEESRRTGPVSHVRGMEEGGQVVNPSYYMLNADQQAMSVMLSHNKAQKHNVICQVAGKGKGRCVCRGYWHTVPGPT